MNDPIANALRSAPQGSVGSLPAEARGEGRVLARPQLRRQPTRRSRHSVFARPGTAPAQASSSSWVLGLAVLRLPTAYELPADFVTDLRADRDRGISNAEVRMPNRVILSFPFDIRNSAFDISPLAAWKSASHTVRAEKKAATPETPAQPAP